MIKDTDTTAWQGYSLGRLIHFAGNRTAVSLVGAHVHRERSIIETSGLYVGPYTVSHKSEYTPHISAVDLLYIFKGHYIQIKLGYMLE